MVEMALYLIGLGLSDEKDISLRGLELARKSDFIYLEGYTSKLSVEKERIEKLLAKKIIGADRNLIEQKSGEILKKAEKNDVAILVVGDPLSATTHIELINSAEKNGIRTKIVHNASIINAIAITGLQLYKFGKTTSIPYQSKSFKPHAPYDVLKENFSINAHTLILLDIDAGVKRFMSVNEGIKYLLEIEEERKEKVFTKSTSCIGCSRIGSENAVIKFGTAEELLKEDFGEPLHCIVVPAKLHFVEEETLKKWKIRK